MLTFYLALLENPADAEAFVQMYNEYLLMMTKVSMCYINENHSEDALQMAWIEVARHFTNISSLPSQEIGPYLVTIVKNKCRDIHRKESKYLNNIPYELIDSEVDIERAIAENEEYRLLISIIADLPEIYRTVLERRLVLRQSNKEIANELGIDQSLVAKRYERGRKLIQKQLQEDETNETDKLERRK